MSHQTINKDINGFTFCNRVSNEFFHTVIIILDNNIFSTVSKNCRIELVQKGALALDLKDLDDNQ